MTPLDRLAAMVAKMTPRPWNYSCCYGVATIEHGKKHEPIAHAVDYLKPNNVDGIVALRNAAEELIAVVKAAIPVADNAFDGSVDDMWTLQEALAALDRKLGGGT